MQKKNVLLYVLLTLGSCIFSLAIAEIAIRIALSPQKEHSKITPSERPLFFYAPVDAVTMRGNPKINPTSVYPVAIVGDSFTFAPGMQFDDAFPSRLDRMFQLANTTYPVRV